MAVLTLEFRCSHVLTRLCHTRGEASPGCHRTWWFNLVNTLHFMTDCVFVNYTWDQARDEKKELRLAVRLGPELT